MIKRSVSADRCDRTKPCSTCLTVLKQFSGTHEDAYACMDRSAASRPPTDKSGAECARAHCPYCDALVVQSTLGLFWFVEEITLCPPQRWKTVILLFSRTI